jgi:hypothetical protein
MRRSRTVVAQAADPHDSIKRIASAVGEGATSIPLVHSYLRE